MTADQPREDAIAAGPDAREAFIRRIVALTPGNFTDDFLFLLDRLDEARAAMTTPREDAIAALPVLRLTGEQLDSLNADEFIIDWDEHDEFVRLSQVRAALALADPMTPCTGCGSTDPASHVYGVRTCCPDCEHPAPVDPTADLRTALPGHPSPDRGSGPWVLRLVCCGYDDGIERYATWDEADMFRQTYVTGPGGHDRAAILTRDLDTTYMLALLGIER